MKSNSKIVKTGIFIRNYLKMKAIELLLCMAST